MSAPDDTQVPDSDHDPARDKERTYPVWMRKGSPGFITRWGNPKWKDSIGDGLAATLSEEDGYRLNDGPTGSEAKDVWGVTLG